MKKVPREAELEEAEKKDPRGPRCYECSGFGHLQADCANLKQGKGKAYNATLSDESEAIYNYIYIYNCKIILSGYFLGRYTISYDNPFIFYFLFFIFIQNGIITMA
jgi:hypothetical protein